MPVEDHAVHEKVKQKEGFRYGCHNRERPVKGSPVVSGPGSWPYVFSTTCRFDMSFIDTGCRGCWWQGLGEKYAEEIRRNGK